MSEKNDELLWVELYSIVDDMNQHLTDIKDGLDDHNFKKLDDYQFEVNENMVVDRDNEDEIDYNELKRCFSFLDPSIRNIEYHLNKLKIHHKRIEELMKSKFDKVKFDEYQHSKDRNWF